MTSRTAQRPFHPVPRRLCVTHCCKQQPRQAACCACTSLRPLPPPTHTSFCQAAWSPRFPLQWASPMIPVPGGTSDRRRVCLQAGAQPYVEGQQGCSTPRPFTPPVSPSSSDSTTESDKEGHAVGRQGVCQLLILHCSSLLLKQRQHRTTRGMRWADQVRVNPPLSPHSTSAPQAAAALAPTDA